MGINGAGGSHLLTSSEKREMNSKLTIIKRNAEKLREHKKQPAAIDFQKISSLTRKTVRQIKRDSKSKIQSFNLNYK